MPLREVRLGYQGARAIPSRHVRILEENARVQEHCWLSRETSGKNGDSTCPNVAAEVRQCYEPLAASGTRQPGQPSSTRIGLTATYTAVDRKSTRLNSS